MQNNIFIAKVTKQDIKNHISKSVDNRVVKHTRIVNTLESNYITISIMIVFPCKSYFTKGIKISSKIYYAQGNINKNWLDETLSDINILVDAYFNPTISNMISSDKEVRYFAKKGREWKKQYKKQ